MLKIIKILSDLVKTQKEINENLIKINKNLEPKLETITISADKINTTCGKISALENCYETNVYNKEQTVNAINKECDYRDNFKECDEKNPALLGLIEEYFRYDNKYEIIDLFRCVDSVYEVKKRK